MMQHGYEFNSWEFITAGGPISILVALILLSMSVASWYWIVTKTVSAWRMRKDYAQEIQRFWAAPTLGVAIKSDEKTAISRLAKQAAAAADHYKQHLLTQKETRPQEVISQDEFIARAMNRCMAEESASLESGLTVLASIGSVSPFVGLFGTVWGIYHALASISVSGQATLDKVAGPVGEALIMTAFGLAVAIPAVLAYNALLRSNRALSAELERFAYQLHTLLTTGATLHGHADTTKPTLTKVNLAEVPV